MDVRDVAQVAAALLLPESVAAGGGQEGAVLGGRRVLEISGPEAVTMAEVACMD